MSIKKIIKVTREKTLENRIMCTLDLKDIGPHLTRVRAAVKAHFRALQAGFPYAQLAGVLWPSLPVKSMRNQGDESGLAENLRREIESVLSTWVDQDSQTGKSIVDALTATVEAGFVAAFTAWLVATRIEGEISQDVLLAMQESFKKRAASLIEKIREMIKGATIKVIEDAVNHGLDEREMTQRLEEYFEGKQFNDDLANTVSETEVVEAYHEGGMQLNLDLGTEQKAWKIEDLEACGECQGYADKGLKDIGYVYNGDEKNGTGGILAPPAHPRCRCYMVYAYTSRDNIVNLLD